MRKPRWSSARVLTLTLLSWWAIGPGGCRERVPAKPAVRSGAESRPGAMVQRSAVGRKILLVHSYHAGYAWVDEVSRGVNDSLKDSGVTLEVFYMDAKRHPDEAWVVEAGAKAVQKVDEWKPDVVIASDDAAQEHFGKKYVGKQLPIVFCGVNADGSKYGYPAANITGILERPQFLATLEYFRQFKPVHRIAVLSCNDVTSVSVAGYIKQQQTDVEIVEYKLTNDLEEWKRAIERFNTTLDAVLVYTYHTLRAEGQTSSMEPKAVMAWTSENCKIPIIGVLQFAIEDGALAGVIESPFEHGEKAARYALEILRGAPISSLPVTVAERGQKMVNRRQSARFGIRLTPELLKDAIVFPQEQP